jgi:hypothetical protein
MTCLSSLVGFVVCQCLFIVGPLLHRLFVIACFSSRLSSPHRLFGVAYRLLVACSSSLVCRLLLVSFVLARLSSCHRLFVIAYLSSLVGRRLFVFRVFVLVCVHAQ